MTSSAANSGKAISVEALQKTLGKLADLSVGMTNQGLQRSEHLAIFYAEHTLVVFCMHIGVGPSETLQKLIGNAIVKAVEKHYGFTPAFEKSMHGEFPPNAPTALPLDK